jgi:2'-5' RNA ligase
MRTVELLPDEQLDSSIRRAWGLLVDSALPSQAQHTHVSNRPHVTLAVVDDWDEGTTDALASALSLLPVPLHIDGLRTFGQRRLAVVVSLALELELITVHEAVHDVLEASAWGVEERHLPGRWAPHLNAGAWHGPNSGASSPTAARGTVVAGWAGHRGPNVRHRQSIRSTA